MLVYISGQKTLVFCSTFYSLLHNSINNFPFFFISRELKWLRPWQIIFFTFFSKLFIFFLFKCFVISFCRFDVFVGGLHFSLIKEIRIIFEYFFSSFLKSLLFWFGRKILAISDYFFLALKCYISSYQICLFNIIPNTKSIWTYFCIFVWKS